ncbi:MAG: T9SS type A sorting domain-containing protein [candidate division WOR-3 bacterium]
MPLRFLNSLIIGLFIGTYLLSAQNMVYIETTIPVGSYPYVFAYNPQPYNKVYCANIGSNTVTIIDNWSNAVIATIRVGQEPCAFAYNSTNNKIYCANQKSNDVSIIDGTTNEVINTIPVGTGPSALVYNPVNNKIYCANANSNNVSVIDGVTNNVVATIDVGLYPKTLLYNSINNKIYCANMDSENITVIDGLTNSIITTIPIGKTPVSMCYNSTNNKIYCASWSNGRIHIIDGATDQVIDSIIYGNSGPQSLVYFHLTNQIYYVNFTGDNIKVIDGVTNSVITTIQFPFGARPYALAVGSGDPGWGYYMYCANIGNNTVAVIKMSSMNIDTIFNLPYPIAMIISYYCYPHRIYVANLWSASVTVIGHSFPGIEAEFIKPQSIVTKFLVSPNPARTFFIVHYQPIKKNTMLKITDINGKIIKKVMLTKTKTKIPTNDLNSGIYFVQVNSSVSKIIINK